MSIPRVLFILKRRHAYGPYNTWNHSMDDKPLDSGLSVSTGQLAQALDELMIANKVVQVVDNNCIDKEVTDYSPTHVVIEAFWVVPEKFDILRKLHPTVKWVIRNHSKSDFLSHESGMVGWALDYVKHGLTLACNSPEATHDFKRLAISVGANPKHVVYLPNYYSIFPIPKLSWYARIWKFIRKFGFFGKKPTPKVDGELHVGCFGAIRPLKNHLHQALAAIEAAEQLGVKLKFYINATRVEGKAESILETMRGLFRRHDEHELVEVQWMSHVEFTELVGSMDMVMQVSNSETFNIVAADAVSRGVPVLVSKEIPWLDGEYHANPNNVQEIATKLKFIWLGSGNKTIQADQLYQLYQYAQMAKHLWYDFLVRHHH
jgi:glycosyltransferase involved in cell wall biosynthesis